MARYEVALLYSVVAPDPAAAEELARQMGHHWGTQVRAIEEIPEDAHDYMRHYVQTRETLDAVWDEYMDRTVVQSLFPRDNVPQLPTLGSSITNPGLSLLFDLAITAHEQATNRAIRQEGSPS